MPHLSVTITSILKNAAADDNFDFFILDGGISEKHKNNLNKLKKIKDFYIEFIKIDDDLFKDVQMSPECKHISKQTYYRYLIPKIKPEIGKCLYLDCDVVVKSSLKELWKTELSDCYVAAVEELYSGAVEDYSKLGLDKYFNAGVLLINNKLWQEDNIADTLFKNQLKLQDKIRWQDQDVMNYTFKDRVRFVSPKYNLQQNAFFDTHSVVYSDEEIRDAINNPVIIHFNGAMKPWNTNCRHKLWKSYYDYLKFTPYKNNYYKFLVKKFIKSVFKG